MKIDMDKASKTYKLKNLVTFNTRDNALLDCIYTNINNKYSVDRIPPIGNSDHSSIIAKSSKKESKRAITKTTIPDVSPSRRQLFGELMAKANFIYNLNESIENNCNDMISKIQSIYTHCFPLKTIKIYNNNNCPWINNTIRIIIKKRDIAYSRNQKIKFHNLKRKVKIELCKAKKRYLSNIESLKTKKEWEKVKSYCLMPKENANNNFDPEEINNHFSSVFTNDDWNIEFDMDSLPSQPTYIRLEEVTALMKSCKKGGGYPFLPSWIIRDYSQILAEPITTMFNQSIQKGYVPTVFKTNSVTPIPKVKLPKAPSDFRPITATSPFLKILEKLVLKKWLQPLLEAKKERFDDQFAFIPLPGRGCQTALTLIYGKLVENVDKKLFTSAVLIDFSKAFDCVLPSRILNSLASLGAPLECVTWINSFLSNRSQSTKVGNRLSKFKEITSGTPQGSIISPIIFAILLSGLLPLNNMTHYVKYADDLTILTRANTRAQLDIINQDAVNHVQQWCIKEKMNINENKTKIMHFKSSKKEHKKIFLNNKVLEEIQHTKLLGVHIQTDLKWTLHFEKMIDKAASRIYNLILLRRSDCNVKICVQFYKYMIKSYLTYCCPCFINAPKYLVSKVERFEKRCYRIIRTERQETINDSWKNICQKLANQVTANPDHPLRTLFSNRSASRTRSNKDFFVASGNTSIYLDSFVKFFL